MADPLVVDSTRAAGEPNLRWTWQRVEDALRGLQFGSITLLVQDGVVVQVERTERKRYQRSPRTPN
ncbi:MAG TPA: YezD family protein [Gemmataceae bacterium]|jgi:hypothetical protein